MLDPPMNARQDVRDVYVRFLEVLRQAALSNVAIYTVDPRGLRAPGSASVGSRTMSAGSDALVLSDDLMSTLAALATETGGIQTRWTNDLEANFDRLLSDSRQYYRLAYLQPEPPPGRKQPPSRRITVKVARPGVDVRARRRYAPAVTAEKPKDRS
jgi:VWFA-related protein